MAESEKKHPGGRPTKFTKELGEEICRRIASGRTTLSVSKDEDMPHRETIALWVLDEKKKEFSDLYARARNLLLEHWSDEIVEIAQDDSRDVLETTTSYTDSKGNVTERDEKRSDNTAVNRDKLRTDSRKWLLSKLKPERYGDKLELNGKDGGPLIAVYRDK